MSRIFISYSFKEPDLKIASQFSEELKMEHEIFLASKNIRLGDSWAEEVDKALESCDYFLLLLSERSMHSEMVTEEVRRVKKLRDSRENKKPVILPVRINLPFEKDINYELAGYLNRIQQRLWESDEDTNRILSEIREILHKGSDASTVYGADKITVADTDVPIPNAPLELEIPEGKMCLQSKFYIDREGEQSFMNQILKPGSLLRIKAPRQFGKTSLLSRVLKLAKDNNYQVISLSFQQLDEGVFSDLNQLLMQLCAFTTRNLKLPLKVDEFWDDEFLGLKMKCSSYFENYLLDKIDTNIVLAIDEADRLFKYKDVSSDFFSMLRVWHEDAKDNKIWQKLHLAVTHSTEVNLSMEEINQSPFGNVGSAIMLKEFTFDQVKDLVKRHQLKWEDIKINQLMDIIGGYPFLVRKALYEIAENNISYNAFLKEAATDNGPYGDHLRRHFAILNRKPELLKEMKFIMENERANDLLCYHRLMAGGLVKGDSSSVKLSFKLYRMYFNTRL
jgi:hypothetical protein